MCDIEHAIGHFLFKFSYSKCSHFSSPSRANLSFYLFHLFELTFSMAILSSLFWSVHYFWMECKWNQNHMIQSTFYSAHKIMCVRLCDFMEWEIKKMSRWWCIYCRNMKINDMRPRKRRTNIHKKWWCLFDCEYLFIAWNVIYINVWQHKNDAQHTNSNAETSSRFILFKRFQIVSLQKLVISSDFMLISWYLWMKIVISSVGSH